MIDGLVSKSGWMCLIGYSLWVWLSRHAAQTWLGHVLAKWNGMIGWLNRAECASSIALLTSMVGSMAGQQA